MHWFSDLGTAHGKKEEASKTEEEGKGKGKVAENQSKVRCQEDIGGDDEQCLHEKEPEEGGFDLFPHRPGTIKFLQSN